MAIFLYAIEIIYTYICGNRIVLDVYEKCIDYFRLTHLYIFYIFIYSAFHLHGFVSVFFTIWS